jgi:hypothetical protein
MRRRTQKPWPEAVSYLTRKPARVRDKVTRLRREQQAAVAILRQLG